jgi:subtilase family serine protease
MRTAVAALMVVAVILTTAAGASAAEVRIGRMPALPAGSSLLSALAPATQMQIAIALQPRDPAALAAYAESVSNPGSADYRHFLSVAKFAARFAPSQATIAGVAGALRAEGLDPGTVYANHLVIPVSGSAGAVERALEVSLVRIKLADGRIAVIADEPPALSAALASDVQAVVGLNGLSHPLAVPLRPTVDRHHAVSRKPDAAAAAPCAAASSAASQQGAYTVNQVASAYDFNGVYGAGDQGQGITVGLYELEPNLPSDIASYESCYGISTKVSYVEVDGGSGSGAGSGEAALDIEQIIGFAPRVHLIVYQGPNSNGDSPGDGSYDVLATIVSDDAAKVVSSSWGQCEVVEGATDAHGESTLLEEAAAQGQTLVQAAGDDGSEDCFGETATGDLTVAVDDPGSQPFMTDVGGTSMSAAGSPPTEKAWNNGGNLTDALMLGSGGAGGGGISTFWSMPAYQSQAPASLKVDNSLSSGSPCHASGFCREVPDVSANADPNTGYIFFYNGNNSVADAPAGWQAIGGTSTAAPLWAAAFALADASQACDKVTLGFINPALYKLAGQSQSTYFHDIASGNNDYTGLGLGKYPATAGYDMATGLGSPNVSALVAGLCSDGLRPTAVGSQLTFADAAVHLLIRAHDFAGETVHYVADGLPAGLSLDGADHTIVGSPRRAGDYNVLVTIYDGAGSLRQERFTWTVARRPTVSAARISGGTLSLTITRGSYEPKLSRVSIVFSDGRRFSAALSGSVAHLRLSLGSAATRALLRAARGGNVRAVITVVDRRDGRSALRSSVRVVG